MPLSEHEQRLLDEMERSLYRNDADFVATANIRRGKPNYRMIVTGALVAIAGVIVVLIGIGTRLPIVGVIGFAVLLGGVLLTLARPKVDGSVESLPADSTRTGFMDRMNERWDKRQEEQGR